MVAQSRAGKERALLSARFIADRYDIVKFLPGLDDIVYAARLFGADIDSDLAHRLHREQRDVDPRNNLENFSVFGLYSLNVIRLCDAAIVHNPTVSSPDLLCKPAPGLFPGVQTVFCLLYSVFYFLVFWSNPDPLTEGLRGRIREMSRNPARFRAGSRGAGRWRLGERRSRL
ncbi:MAG TPA: hypothetical protein VNL14_23390 [Candidatus Acidoferrales bacterium]|nr:hypothetical protein [Candidatus Acidoferrales bacterium]